VTVQATGRRADSLHKMKKGQPGKSVSPSAPAFPPLKLPPALGWLNRLAL